MAEISGIVGQETAEAIQTLLERVRRSGQSLTASLIALATLLLGATRVFTSLKQAIDSIWELEAELDRVFFSPPAVSPHPL